jgi:hypothetical protein
LWPKNQKWTKDKLLIFLWLWNQIYPNYHSTLSIKFIWRTRKDQRTWPQTNSIRKKLEVTMIFQWISILDWSNHFQESYLIQFVVLIFFRLAELTTDAWYGFNSIYEILQSFSIHSCEQWTFSIIFHVLISKNHDVNVNVKVLINYFEPLGTFKFPLFVPCFYTPSLELVNPYIHDVFHIFLHVYILHIHYPNWTMFEFYVFWFLIFFNASIVMFQLWLNYVLITMFNGDVLVAIFF